MCAQGMCPPFVSAAYQCWHVGLNDGQTRRTSRNLKWFNDDVKISVHCKKVFFFFIFNLKVAQNFSDIKEKSHILPSKVYAFNCMYTYVMSSCSSCTGCIFPREKMQKRKRLLNLIFRKTQKETSIFQSVNEKICSIFVFFGTRTIDVIIAGACSRGGGHWV